MCASLIYITFITSFALFLFTLLNGSSFTNLRLIYFLLVTFIYLFISSCSHSRHLYLLHESSRPALLQTSASLSFIIHSRPDQTDTKAIYPFSLAAPHIHTHILVHSKSLLFFRELIAFSRRCTLKKEAAIAAIAALLANYHTALNSKFSAAFIKYHYTLTQVYSSQNLPNL